MWYAVMRKEVREGVYIGALCLRHQAHHASLLQEGWQEVEPASIGSAASHGCIRMLIPDVIELYDQVPVGAPIYIA